MVLSILDAKYRVAEEAFKKLSSIGRKMGLMTESGELSDTAMAVFMDPNNEIAGYKFDKMMPGNIDGYAELISAYMEFKKVDKEYRDLKLKDLTEKRDRAIEEAKALAKELGYIDESDDPEPALRELSILSGKTDPKESLLENDPMKNEHYPEFLKSLKMVKDSKDELKLFKKLIGQRK